MKVSAVSVDVCSEGENWEYTEFLEQSRLRTADTIERYAKSHSYS